MLFSDFNKVMPLLKYGFYVNWNGKEQMPKWHSYKDFAEKYDFKKIQIIECRQHFSYDTDFDFELILKKI